ncbi:Transglutaminase-like superfamily protein [Pseudarcicella hirudinis]|uniref:Transglutaminase-like superfamily protein n=1 Tax=Pseudarcicella hirudinis TaxID=1079859 RepID=A0A1I5WDI0_9BACT|nr:transglutaminase-like domain-containing protein [Pseudarcicella hirudinis]SFQ17386.1 Transglutaminase-like superfamily protein [Pseudarcicella hirudinis]
MNENEIKALISLLDDEDQEVATLVEDKIRSLGGEMIPYLEDRWEDSSLNPLMQRKIEELIHDLQYKSVIERLTLWKEGGAMDLLEGMWAVATYQYPDLSYEKLRTSLDQIYYDVWIEFREGLHPMDQVKVLNSVIFSKLKFGANTKNFHSANNSMLNIVLETHRGNPISLCVIYMLIAQKLGVPLYGVNLPNLFVLTYKKDNFQFYLNVFNKGLVFSKIDIDNYIAQLNLTPNDIFYQPCSNLDIIKRVLRNLILAFEKTGDDDRVKEVEHILKAIS